MIRGGTEWTTHKNAPLTPKGREATVRSVMEPGSSKAAAARQFNTTPKTVAKWVERFHAEGVSGLRDRSSRPHSLPSQTALATSSAISVKRHPTSTEKIRVWAISSGYDAVIWTALGRKFKDAGAVAFSLDAALNSLSTPQPKPIESVGICSPRFAGGSNACSRGRQPIVAINLSYGKHKRVENSRATAG